MITSLKDMVWTTRTVTPLLPARIDRVDGLALTVWLPPPPADPPRAGVVVLHGAGSSKESHYDFARALVALGLAAVNFDQRGHGESDGRLDGRAVQDVVTVATVLRDQLGDERAPIALRGSSMGGYLAIMAAGPVRAAAIVAICPASAEGLRRGLTGRRFDFRADEPALDALLAAGDLATAVGELTVPLLLLHAEGDEQVPVQHSRELATAATAAGSRLITVPGGHHRSVQHDPELQAVSLRFIARALADALNAR